MKHDLGTEKIPRLLWQLSLPAILGMLSSAIFNIVDRIFVGKIHPNALTAVGITMPVQVFQMAFVLLIGIGTSSLISIKLGEDKKEEAEQILFLALKYIVIFLIGFALLFLVFMDQILNLLAISEQVMPYARTYIMIIVIGSITGIPGYCLNNSLRSIGQAAVSMKIIIITSIMNIILDPIFIFGLGLGIGGAAIATVISQTTLTVYVIAVFVKRKDFIIHLKLKKVQGEFTLLKESLRMGMPSFYVQLLATLVNIFINNRLLIYGTDYDVAAVTIMSSIFSFYHMVVVGIAQGNNAICGYNWGAGKYERVRKTLELSVLSSFLLSVLLYGIVQGYPHLLIDLFTKDSELSQIASGGIKVYLGMLPLVGIQIIGSQYFQAVGKAGMSSVLSFLRYGIIIVPAILILAPVLGTKGIYLSNAISDGIASVAAIICILYERKRLKNQTENKHL